MMQAGLCTVLNARTSVLAAANPIFGSYDDGRGAEQNIQFHATILSRFDSIFLIKVCLVDYLFEKVFLFGLFFA
jgi:DNA replication licensing factor MCM5